MLPDRVTSKKDFEEYQNKAKKNLEEEITKKSEKAGITFLSFKSADCMIRFIRFIKK